MEFGLEFAIFRKTTCERLKFAGRKLMLLQFTEQPAELLREARPAATPPE